jgi:hypothetical protein
MCWATVRICQVASPPTAYRRSLRRLFVPARKFVREHICQCINVRSICVAAFNHAFQFSGCIPDNRVIEKAFAYDSRKEVQKRANRTGFM